LPDESLFRKNLPHFDRPQAHREHLRALADRIRDILSQSTLSDQIRDWQRERAMSERSGRFNLPSRDHTTLYRVRSLGVRVDASGGGPVVQFPGGTLPLEPQEESAAAWILARDYIETAELEQRFGELGADGLGAFLERLEAASVLDKI